MVGWSDHKVTEGVTLENINFKVAYQAENHSIMAALEQFRNSKYCV